MTTAPVSAELLRVLEHERGILGRLQLAMMTVRLLLAAGENRFLSSATDEIHDLLDAVGVTEAMRAAVTADVATRLGIDDPEPALSAIVAALPTEEGVELDNLGEALRRAMIELGEVGSEGAEIAVQSIGGIRGTLARLTGAAAGEGREPPHQGWLVDGPTGPSLYDSTL